MATDIDQSHYNTGTAAVAGTAVTGQGTTWLGTIRKGDLFGTHKGSGVRIASVDSNTSLTLAYAVPALEQTAAAYEIQRTPFDVGYYQALENLLVLLGGGNLEAFAGLNGLAGKVPVFTGPATLDLLSKIDLVSGVEFDVQVANIAARAAYDGQAAGFAVLVGNIGDGRSAIYSKVTNASGNWSAPAYLTGPSITLDVTEVDEVPYGTPPQVNMTPRAGGYDLAFDIPRGMLIEPGTTTTLAPDQPAAVTFVPVTGGYRLDIAIPRGPTGDIDGVTPFWVSRLGSDVDAPAARAGLGAASLGANTFTGLQVLPSGSSVKGATQYVTFDKPDAGGRNGYVGNPSSSGNDIYLAAEAGDIFLSPAGNIRASSRRIADLAAGIDPNDAVRMAQIAGVYKPSNIVGTVSQAGGIPTGAIIEYGGNINGSFTKFADGTMIVWGGADGGILTTSVSSGVGFQSAVALGLTYPAAFISAPWVVPMPLYLPGSPARAWVTVASRGGSTTVSLIAHSFSTGAEVFGTYIAVGRWI